VGLGLDQVCHVTSYSWPCSTRRAVVHGPWFMVLHELVHDVRLGWLTVKRVLAESCRDGVWGTRCRDEEIGVVVLAGHPAGQKAASGLPTTGTLAQALSQVAGEEGITRAMCWPEDWTVQLGQTCIEQK
jgi:hypothetical protein